MTRNDVMNFWREKRRKNEMKRNGGGKMKRDAKDNRGLFERDDVTES